MLEPTEYTAPPGTVFHGRSGLRSFMRALLERFPNACIRPTEFRPLESMVLVLGEISRDPAEAAVDRALLFELEDGLVRRVRAHHTESEALEAAARSVHDGFHAVFDAAAEPMLLLDDDGRLADANAAGVALLGLDRARWPELGFADLLESDQVGWTESWRRLESDGQSSGRVRLLTDGGRAVELDFWMTADYRAGQHLLLLREPEPPAPAAPVLTSREREILELLARGLTSPKIADHLVLSPATVRTHVQNAVAKLNAATRVQAIARAIALGEIEAEPDGGGEAVAGAGFEPA